STSQSEIDSALARISRQGETLHQLLAELQDAGVDSASLVALQVDIGRLRDNLEQLNRLVNSQLAVGEQKNDLLRQANYDVGALRGLLIPFLSVNDELIGQWRRTITDASLPPERRQETDVAFEKSLAQFFALQSSEVLASGVSDLLQRAASA